MRILLMIALLVFGAPAISGCSSEANQTPPPAEETADQPAGSDGAGADTETSEEDTGTGN